MVMINRDRITVGSLSIRHPIIRCKILLSGLGLFFCWFYLGLVVMLIPAVILVIWLGSSIGGLLSLALAIILVGGLSYRGYRNTVASLKQQGEQLSRESHPQLSDTFDFLEQECNRRGMNVPELWYIDSDVVNAFAIGGRKNGYVALTDGVMRSLDENELHAVIAHELSHLDHRDSWLMTTMCSIKTIIYSGLCKIGFAFRLGYYQHRGVTLSPSKVEYVKHKVRKRTRWLVAPIAFLEKVVSRQREYVADTEAAEASTPIAIIGALETIEESDHQPDFDVVLSLCIIGKTSGFLARLRSTHPRTTKRIKRIERVSDLR